MGGNTDLDKMKKPTRIVVMGDVGTGKSGKFHTTSLRFWIMNASPKDCSFSATKGSRKETTIGNHTCQDFEKWWYIFYKMGITCLQKYLKTFPCQTSMLLIA